MRLTEHPVDLAAIAARATVAMSSGRPRDATGLLGCCKLWVRSMNVVANAHFGEAAHVHDEVPIAVHRPTLRQPHTVVARFLHLAHRMGHAEAP